MKQEPTGNEVVPYPKVRRLYRSGSNRMIAGVAGGMAEYFGIDPTFARVGWVIAGIMGWGLIAYVVCWILVPQEPTT